MSEADIQNKIRVALSQYGIPFRTNAGDFWQGTQIYSTEYKQDILINIRRVKGLPKGFPDLLFVGDDGRISFLECKTEKGRLSAEQKKILEQFQKMNIRCQVVRSPEEAIIFILGGK